jgi:hypothetical protein
MTYELFFVLAGTVGAALWIATVILIQQTRDTLKTVPSSAGLELDIPKAIWVWSITVTWLTSTLFQTVIFWSLLWLIPEHHYYWPLRLAGAIALAVLIRDGPSGYKLWRGVIGHAGEGFGELRKRIAQITPPWVTILAIITLVAGYLMTIILPNDMGLAIFCVLCLYLAVSVILQAIASVSAVRVA